MRFLLEVICDPITPSFDGTALFLSLLRQSFFSVAKDFELIGKSSVIFLAIVGLPLARQTDYGRLYMVAPIEAIDALLELL